MILTTGGLQGFRNAYGNLLRKVRIRWWGTAGESHGGALFSSMWTSTSPAEHAAYNGFFLKQRRETKRTIFSANFFFLYCLKRIIIKMSIVRSSNSSVSSGVTSKENLKITFLNFFFSNKFGDSMFITWEKTVHICPSCSPHRLDTAQEKITHHLWPASCCLFL